jgi:hypothetical protein
VLSAVVLRRALPLLEARAVEFEGRVRGGDETAWPGYLRVLSCLAAILAQAEPRAGELLTTAELAARMGVAPKTLLRRRARGEIQAVQLGKRGRAALRWRADAASGGGR